MSQDLDNVKVKFVVFDRKQLQKNKLHKNSKHLERKDFFDIQASQWKYLSNYSSIDRGIASRTTATLPLVWRTLLPPNFVLDAYGDQEVRDMHDILKYVEENTWHNLPLNGEILIKKYTTVIEQRRRNKMKLEYVNLKQPIKAAMPIENNNIVNENAETPIFNKKTTTINEVPSQMNDVVVNDDNVSDELQITKKL